MIGRLKLLQIVALVLLASSLVRPEVADASRVADCPAGYTNVGLFCTRPADSYSASSRTADCPSGYTNIGLACGQAASSYSAHSRTADCSSGYKNIGLTCLRGASSYSAPSRTADCPPGWTNMGLYCGKGLFGYKGSDSMRCRNNEFKKGVRCYDKCRPGYNNIGEACLRRASTKGPEAMRCGPGEFKNGVRCYNKCRAGYTNIGEACHKPASTRGAASMSCRSGEFKTGVRCYKNCRPGYTNIGEVCHRPVSTLGHASMKCKPGEVLNIGRCFEPTEAGGTCWAGAPCGKGFECAPLVHKCLPEKMEVSAEAYCSAFKVDDLSKAAKDAGITMSYGNGSAGSLFGITGAQEIGTVYGENGEFGCFASHCYGGVTDLSISTYAVFGFYDKWESFAGVSRSISEGVDTPLIEGGFTTAQVINEEGTLIGTTDSVSIGVGILPMQVGLLKCVTTVIDGEVGLNELNEALETATATVDKVSVDEPPPQVVDDSNRQELLARSKRAVEAVGLNPRATPPANIEPSTPRSRSRTASGPCAKERENCEFHGTRTVFYGARNSWIARDHTNGVACVNAVFTDPLPNVVKTCYATMRCATERQNCSFQGTRKVFYGAGNLWVVQQHSNGVRCDNRVFGDPIRGTVKACYVSN